MNFIIGHEDEFVWKTDYDSSWRVIKPNNSFVDVYFINITQSNEINLIVNVTRSTDLDVSIVRVKIFCRRY